MDFFNDPETERIMESHRMPKRTIEGKIYGKLPIGKPNDRWIDAVTLEIQLLGKATEKSIVGYISMEEGDRGAYNPMWAVIS